MAQNINNVQYVHMANPGVGQAPPPGQTYQLPQNSLVGLISTSRSNPNSRSTTLHKANMGIGGDANKDMYSAWRDLVKDLIIARNYVPGARAAIYPDADFQPIVAGMRRLRPACDGLATASAAGNVARMQDIDEAVVHLVKDCVVKLFNTTKTRGPAAVQGQPGVPFAQIMVPGIFLSTNIPAQWGLATAVPNVAPVPQNAPPGNAPPAPPGNNQAPAPPPPPPPPPGNNQAPARLLPPPPPPPPRKNQAPARLLPLSPPPPPRRNQAPARLLPLSPPPPPKRNQAQPPIIPPRPVVDPAPPGNNQAQPPIIPPRPLSVADPAPLFYLGSSSSDDDSAPSVDDPVSPADDPALPVDDPALPVADPALPVDDPALPVDDPALPVADPALPVADPAPAPIAPLPPANRQMANYMPTG